MKTIKVVVNWDTDGQKVDLPEVVEVPENTIDIADYLSDEYGWCVNSFFIEEITIPVYYAEIKGKKIIDEEGMRTEFEQELKKILKS